MSDIVVAPRAPWEPDNARRALRGSVVLRTRYVPDHLPSRGSVRAGLAVPALLVDDGPVDAVLRRFAHATLATRVHAPASGRPESRTEAWDELEHQIGLSRAVRVRVETGVSILRLVEALRDLGTIEVAAPDYLCESPFGVEDAGGPPTRSWERVGGAEALAMEEGDPSLIVGVIDSGAAVGHLELGGRLRPGADTVDLPQDDLSRSLQLIGDSAGRDRNPLDEQGHGTTCCGIIGARGERVPPGLAGKARVLPVRALAAAKSADREGTTAIGAISDIDAAVKLAIDLGARVLNLSFGTPKSSLRDDDPVPHVEVVRYALARGCVLVAASGNAGDDVPYFPAALPGVIAVGAVDTDDRPCTFSSFGPHVALTAPGRQVLALALDGYRRVNGTSFAAPFVTGAAALLLARAARYATPLDPMDVARILRETARPFSPPQCPGHGAGILDVPAALRRLDAELDVREVA